MALLVADIGNSHTGLGLVERAHPEGVVAQWRVSTDERRTADEWAVLVRGLLHGAVPHGIAIAATVPSVLQVWRGMAADHFGDLPVVVVEPGTRTGLPILMDNPREVGADRICNAVAVAELVGGPAIVVDFGTAITFDVLNRAGQYVGGAIAPGVEIGLEALSAHGAQLHTVEVLAPRTVIAKNTVEALQSGIVFGTAAQVDGMVGRMIDELGEDGDDVTVMATGYLADLMFAQCTVFDRVEPWLTLVGVAAVYERQA